MMVGRNGNYLKLFIPFKVMGPKVDEEKPV